MPLAVFSDFDGTLSEIVPDPQSAVPVPGAVDALALLRDAGARVGVITGRPAAWMQATIGLDGVVYRGLHGLERAEGLAPPEPIEELSALEPEIERVRTSLERQLRDVAGPELEDKRYAFAVHYRHLDDADAAECVREICAQAIGTGDFDLKPGKMIWEILPAIEMNKGIALEEEARRAAAGKVVFAGDDMGDIYAFEALDRLERDGFEVEKVGVRSEGLPPELVDAVDTVVDGPTAAAAYFARLAEAIPDV